MEIPDYLRPPQHTSSKIWGTLQLENGQWVVEGNPYMVSMAKRVFPGSKGRGRGRASFPAAKRIIGDLNWFMQRFPLEVKDKERWQNALGKAQQHFLTHESFLEKPTKVSASLGFHGKLYEFQKEGLAFLLNNPRSLLADDMGLGKALPLDSFLLTPDGWIMMKYIKTGDFLIGSNGKPTKVVGVFPQGKRPVYKVTFSDESSIECDEEHIWAVNTPERRHRNNEYKLFTLKQIMEIGIKRKYNNVHFIPIVSPIQFKKRNLLLEPYLLGVLLGDGCFRRNGMIDLSTPDIEILEKIKNMLPVGIKIKKKKRDNYDYTLIKNTKQNDYNNKLNKIIEGYGLRGKKSVEKYIPEEYLFSSCEDRVKLLQGLLDTDGSVTHHDNHIEYSTSSKVLGEQVKFLVESLGGTVKLTSRIPWYTYNGEKRIGKRSYRLTVALPREIKPFTLKKKADFYHPRKKYQPYRAITKIESVGEKECQCVKVDAEDGLFVIDHCIVTHNTIQALSWLGSLEESAPALIVVPPHLLRQWKSEIYRFLGDETVVHTISGLKPYSLPFSEIYLIHYLILRGWRSYLPQFGFKTLIFDEIQELRRAESEKYSVASLISEAVDNVIGLSGTPIYNFGSEIWHILNILEYHCLGDWESFSREWCHGYGSKVVNDPEVLGEYLRTEGLMLRRRKEDVLDELPPKRRVIQNIDIDEGKFDELIAPVIDQANKIPTIKDAFERGRESMQAIDSTRMITGIAKAPFVCGFVKTLMEAGEKVILYGHHHAVMDIFIRDLKEYYPVMISGRQTGTVKDQAQKAFTEGDTDLIIVSLRSGLGLNLQRAHCVVFGELDWSPAVLSQCEDRAHRIGQKDSVLCYYLTCNAGTDQAMMETLGMKVSQFIGIMGDKAETEHDKLMAQVDVKKHMTDVIKLLQEGGRKKEISDREIVERLRKLERLPTKKEPTSIHDFYRSID